MKSKLQLKEKNPLFLTLCIVATLFSVELNAQSSVCGTATTVATFGVDGNPQANSPSPGIDDWFIHGSFPGSGVGVIGTSAATAVPPLAISASAFQSILQAASSSNGRNLRYEQRMSVPWLTVVGNSILIDAVAARDNISSGGASDSTVFAGGGDKNGDNPATWGIGPGAVQQKNDLVDVGGHLRRDLSTGDLWCFGYASTLSTSGDGHTDFEFFRNPVVFNTSTGSVSNSGPASSGGHVSFVFNSSGQIISPGDVLVGIDHGGSSTATVRIWIKPTDVDGAGNDTAWLNSQSARPFNFTGAIESGASSNGYGWAEIRPKTAGGCLVYSLFNPAAAPATPWGSLTGSGANWSANLDPVQWVEIAINFSDYGLDLTPVSGPCFNLFGSLVIKTRSSASFSSEIKDFAGPFTFGNFAEVQAEAGADKILNCQINQVTLDGSSITPGASFIWTTSNGNIVSGANTATPLVNAPGTYILQVTNPTFGTCIATDTVIVSQNITAPNVNAGSDQSITCLTGSSINLNGSSTSSNVSFSWTSMGGGNIVSGANTLNPIIDASGCYILTVSDLVNLCSASDTVCVSINNSAPSIQISTTTPVNCFGDCSGEISTVISGGSGPFSYSWSNGATSGSLTNLCAGTYTLTVTGSNGCIADTSVNITQPVAALSGSLSSTPVNCYGGSNGSLTSSISGGTAPYSYLWSTGSTGSSLLNIISGSYTLTVTDSRGCSIVIDDFVPQPLSPLSLNTTKTDILCHGNTSGAAQVIASGGTPSYSYLWSNGGTGMAVNSLAAGTYSVTVTDANACTAQISVSVLQPLSPLSLNSTQTEVSCNGGNDGTIQTTVSGGTAPYSYLWSNGAGSASINSLAAGNYTLTVTDVNGCTLQQSFTVTEPSAPLSVTALTQVNVSCFGGNNASVSLSVSGGTPVYTYAWSNGASTFSLSNLSSASYTVTVSDMNGCTDQLQINIAQPPAPLSLSLNATSLNCFGDNNGEISSTVSGGTAPYSYSWSNGSTSPVNSNLAAGTYTLTVTDAMGCIQTGSLTLNQPAQPLGLSETHTDLNCTGIPVGSIDVTTDGGTSPYTYNWSNGSSSEDIANLSAGVYVLTVTDANGCTSSITVVISQPAGMVNVSSTTVNIPCYGLHTGSIDITAFSGTPGYTYLWNDGTTTEDRSGLEAGVYTVTVTDRNGCMIIYSVWLTQPDSALLVSASSQALSCFGDGSGSIDVVSLGGTAPYSYSWSNGSSSEDLSGLQAGSYTVLVTDANGCTSTLTQVVNQPSAPLSISSTVQQPNCHDIQDGSIQLTVGGGTMPYLYVWNDGLTIADRDSLSPGNYTVTVTDANGCSATSSYTIAYAFAELIAGISVSSPVACHADSSGTLVLNVIGGLAPYSYNWSNGSILSNPGNLPSGTYSVTVTDQNGCTGTAMATITQPLAGLSLTYTLNPVYCHGDSTGWIDISVGGGTPPYSYSWSNGSSQEDPANLFAGNYTVTVSDANGCTLIQSITIVQPAQALNATATAVNVLCYGDSSGSLQINVNGGTPGYSYLWNGVAGGSIMNQLAAGTYSVVITDSAGCQLAVSDSIVQPAAPINLTASVVNASCQGASDGSIDLNVTGGTSPYTYLWTNNFTGQDPANLLSGIYGVLVTDANGCSDSLQISISQPALTLSVTFKIHDLLCMGDSSGNVYAYAAGGTLPYSYQWNTGDTTSGLTGIGAGTYNVTITDAQGCTVGANVQVNEPKELELSIDTLIHVNCSGMSSGSINVSVEGGTAPYSFVWNTGSTSQNLNGLGGGMYSVVVTDANGCMDSISTSIFEPTEPLSASFTSTPANCIDGILGNINITASGGTPPYSYSWSNGSSGPNLLNQVPGTYSCTITDSKGCEISLTATIGDNSVLDILSLNGLDLCIGQTATLSTDSVPGGTYQWFYNGVGLNGTNTPQFTTPVAGLYYLNVSTVCGTYTSNTVEITLRALTNISISNNAVLCPGETVQLSAGGGMDYSWSPAAGLSDPSSSSPIASPSQTTTYTVTIKDNYGCTATASVTVNVMCDTLDIPNGYSPNGDGINDVFEIEGIENYPGNVIFIYNRWGNLVYKKNDYLNTWDGRSNVNGVMFGEELPNGTYFFILDLNTNEKPINGFVVLRR